MTDALAQSVSSSQMASSCMACLALALHMHLSAVKVTITSSLIMVLLRILCMVLNGDCCMLRSSYRVVMFLLAPHLAYDYRVPHVAEQVRTKANPRRGTRKAA